MLRQIDRVQRSVNNQEMRLEGVVTVLRDIENLLRNQEPVVIAQVGLFGGHVGGLVGRVRLVSRRIGWLAGQLFGCWVGRV